LPTVDLAQRVQIVVTPGSGEGRAMSTARRIRTLVAKRGGAASIRSFADLPSLVAWAHTCRPESSALVCVGGDATLSAAAIAAIRCEVPLVPVPNGFGNIFARVFGHPDRAEAVVRLLGEGELRRVDVGVVTTASGTDVFLSHRSYGALEQIQQLAERGRQQPKGRVFRYLWYWGVAHQFLFDAGLTPAAVEVDGARVADDAVLVTVANVETYRGFLALTPTASPIDGLFDVFVVPRVSKTALMRRLIWLLLRLPGRWRGVALYRGRRVTVTTGTRREQLTVRRHALPLLVPPGAIAALLRRTVEDEGPPIAAA
jgi:diacylglycerol kinase (ATP)